MCRSRCANCHDQERAPFGLLVKVPAGRAETYDGDGFAAAAAMLAPYERHGRDSCPPQYLGFIDREDAFRARWQADLALAARGTVPLPGQNTWGDFNSYMANAHPWLKRDPARERYGYWGNPNGRWEFFRVRGCQTRAWLVGEGSNSAARAAKTHEWPDTPGPWLRLCVANFEDVDFDEMARRATCQIEDWWARYQRYLALKAEAEALGVCYAELVYRLTRHGQMPKEEFPQEEEIIETLDALGLRQPAPEAGPDGRPRIVEVPFAKSDLLTTHRWHWERYASWAVLDNEGWHDVEEGDGEVTVADMSAWGAAFKRRFLDGTALGTRLVSMTYYRYYEDIAFS